MYEKKWSLFFVVILLIILTACQPAAEPQVSPEEPSSDAPSPGEKTDSESQNLLTPQATFIFATEVPGIEKTDRPTVEATQAPVPTEIIVTDSPLEPELNTDRVLNQRILIDQRYLEFEYPQQLYFGDSDVIRLSLIPVEEGYLVQSEFPDHHVETEPYRINQIEGYHLLGTAQIYALGLDILPGVAQKKLIQPNQDTHWRWTVLAKSPGTHRLTINLSLKWISEEESEVNNKPEVEIFSKAFEVDVRSFFGLNRKQSFVGGFGSLIISGLIGFITLFWKKHPIQKLLEVKIPDEKLKIETKPEINLEEKDRFLLQAMFSGYARILIEREFLSGYSGARTLLILPIHLDSRRDAEMIVKIGLKESIQREYQNYLDYVKQTLPPMTARIQKTPVTTKNGLYAALMYTFVAEPGKPPKSLGRYLEEKNTPNVINQVFDNFGPNWWYQNSPYIYRLSMEFDKKLPSHLSVKPVDGKKQFNALSFSQTDYDKLPLINVGQIIFLEKFDHVERRGDGKSYTLVSKSTSSHAPIRVRWLSADRPRAGLVQVIETRENIYQGYKEEFEHFGLPEPWNYLKKVLNESINGTRSVIHGDLNLENILIGAGGFVWLIDFSETREGPPIYDLSHLALEIVAHLYANKIYDAISFVNQLKNRSLDHLNILEKLAEKCVKPGTGKREYQLALLVSSLGALKYENLSQKSKYFLYIFAAWQVYLLENTSFDVE